MGVVDLSTVGGRLKAARIEAGLSAPRLAEILGYANAQSVYDAESGKSSPDPERLGSYARAVNASLDWIVFGTESADSEFVAYMRGIEDRLDERGKRAILTLAQQQAVERERDEATQRLLSDPVVQARLEELRRAPRGNRRGSDEPAGQEPERPRQGRGQG